MRLSYCTKSDVDIRARDESHTTWLGLTDDAKNQLLYFATDDIKAYHKQPDQYGQPFGYTHLRDAAVSRCLYLARMIGLRDIKERAEYLGADSISDGIMALSNFSKSDLDSATKAEVDNVLRQIGVNDMEFCRG